MSKHFLFGAAAVAALVSVACSDQAKAISYNLLLNDIVTYPTTSANGGHYSPDLTIGPTQVDLVSPPPSSQSSAFRSPWEGTPYGTVAGGTPDATPDLPYTSVRDGTAVYNITGDLLNLFWGSPDSYNTLTFYTLANAQGDSVSLSGSILGNPQGLGHHLVQFTTDVIFRSISIGSGDPAFEFANLSSECSNCALEPVPLPAALPLFATGLGVMGFLNWRRKRKNAAVAAA